MWDFYANGGFDHVASYLTERDISGFDAKAPPPRTEAFWDIVHVGEAPEDAELLDLLESLPHREGEKGPRAITPKRLIAAATGNLAEWMLQNRRALPHRLGRCGYSLVRNPAAMDGYWVINKARQPIYALNSLSMSERVQEAEGLVSR